LSFSSSNKFFDIVNNSNEKTIEKFYIDHTADPSRNGYFITTTEHSVKSVTGFCRYQFKLPPEEKVEVVVSEEAFFVESFSSTTDLINSVKNRFPNLLQEGTIDQEFIHVIKELIARRERQAALQSIVNENYNERNIIEWKSGSSVQTSTLVDGKYEVLPLIGGKMIEKLELVFTFQNKKREIERSTKLLQESIKKIFDNQSRLRENIKTLEKVLDSDLVRRYLRDLENQEDELNNTRKKINTFQEEDAALNEQIKRLKIDISTEARFEIESIQPIQSTQSNNRK